MFAKFDANKLVNILTIGLPLVILLLQQIDKALPDPSFSTKALPGTTEQALRAYFQVSNADFLRVTGGGVDFRLGSSPAFPSRCWNHRVEQWRGELSAQVSFCKKPPHETAGATSEKIRRAMKGGG